MKDNIVSLQDKWIDEFGPNSDVVISSRVRLARNLLDLPFPHLMSAKDIESLFVRVQGVRDKLKHNLEFLSLKDLTELERNIIVEKHLISPELAKAGKGALLLNQDRSISIMVLEEDHFRIQVILPALSITEAWRVADEMDDSIEAHLDIAFNEKYGYMTSCPTNVGTGLRASVMMHLPGLVLSKQANRILGVLSRVGLVVRGIYGEGTEALGNIFQISNQITIGRNEKEIINNLSSVVLKIIDQERNARELLKKETGFVLEDKICRSYGILSNARVISSEEALNLLSDIKLGMDLNIIKDENPKLFKQLMVMMQPAYLQYSAGKEMSAMDRDIYRAEKIRLTLKNS